MPSNRVRHLALWAASVFLLSACPAVASSQPEGVSLYLSLKGGNQQFRLGEVISLRLAFSSSIPGRYSIDMASYDRSGRMDSERFDLQPAQGWSDPLTDYFNSGLFSFMGGGIRGIPELGAEPKIIDLDLNEWIRFDHPGHYRLSVNSSRIIEGRSKDTSGKHLDTRSNEVEFDILPGDNEWAQQSVSQATALLSSRNHEEGLKAARTLRFLGTEAAVAAMVEQFRGDEDGFDGEYMFGLLGSTNRAFAVHEMEEALDRNDHPVSPTFLRTLAVLAYRLDHPEPLPAPPPLSIEQTDNSWELWRQQCKEREEALRPYVRRYLARLMDSVSNRRGRPFAEALVSVMVEGSEVGALEDPAFGAFFSSLRREIPALFSQLPKSTQDSLLSFWWNQIRSDDMLPVLRKMYDNTPNFSRGQYLLLINDLDSQQARALVLEDMQRPDPTLLYDEIHVFGNELLPQLDDVLASRLEEAQRNDTASLRTFAMLVQRHVTGRVLPKVEATYERLGESVDCTVKANLLAYFLRVDLNYGKKQLERIQPIQQNAFRGCENSALGIALDRKASAEIEHFATARLWNPDPIISLAAADTLREHGSKDAEESLWKRLREWHEQWLSHSENERDLQYKTQLQLGTALLKAIAQGNSWLADEDKLTQLRDFCGSKEQCAEVDSFKKLWKHGPELEIIVFNSQEIWPHVAQYEFRSLDRLWPKLAQFPRGTRLSYDAEYQPEEKEHADHILAELTSFAEDHGLQIDIKNPPK